MMKTKEKLNLEEALHHFKNGKMIIVADDVNRENEGDFIISAEKATHKDINFMMKEGRGLICVPITKAYSSRLNLGPMVSDNTSIHETNFTVSVDAKNNTTTTSSKEVTNANNAPEITPGRINGKVIFIKVFTGLLPRLAAALVTL